MLEPLQITLYALSGILALLTLAYVALGRLPDNLLVAGLALLELGLVAQALIGLVQVVTADRDLPAFTFIGYLVGVLVILPIGFVWAIGEKSRSGTAVLLIAVGVVPVLILRLEQIWATGV